MAMFDNPKKELAELEEQLLKEEEWFNTELEQAKSLIGEEPVKKPKASKAKTGSAPQKKGSGKKKAKPEEKPKSNKGLVILAVLETLGIVGIVAYWVLFLL